jgi:predicted kinase
MARRPPVIDIPDRAASPRPRSPGRPLVVELAGLAGSGKSAVALALGRLDPQIRARPRVAGPSHLASVPALIPTFVRLHRPFRGVLTKEMKRMLHLHALYRFARGTTGRGTVVFDEGPIYMLARIVVFGGDNIRSPGFERWWGTTVAEWAATLDAVVWLDAPDEVLAARVHSRRQRHPLQGADDGAVTAFFHAYREAFTEVLDALRVARGPQVWTVATDQASADQTARALLERLHALPAPGPTWERA